MPDDCPVGKVEVELRFSVQLELSTVVGKSPLRWAGYLPWGLLIKGPIHQSDTKYFQDRRGVPRFVVAAMIHLVPLVWYLELPFSIFFFPFQCISTCCLSITN